MSRWRLLGGALLTAGVVTVMTLLNFDGVNIALGAVATVALSTLTGHREIGGDLGWPALPADERGGHRHEVSQLSWSLTDRDGRVGERGLRRLRDVAAGRLRLAGIDPDDDDAVRAAIGEHAWRTLRITRDNRPTVRALDACLTALDDLQGAPHES
ncbi:hypothetical protein [Georgenia sp. MJ170]|uniref:hypothetical protein n=1 Tax=Georgenia sunbinii TaxID=3117728 RepID=UPI002F2648CB